MSSEKTGSEGSDPNLTLVQRFFSGTGPSYDFVVNAATFGVDRRWKRIIIDQIPPNPVRVLDLACGTGILTFGIARRYPNCRVVGVELRDEYLQIARDKLQSLGLGNVEFVLSRAEEYSSTEAFDCIVSSYLAKYVNLPVVTRNAKMMLKESGLLLMHDFTYPPKKFLVRVWRIYFKLLQMVGTPLFPAWREIFHGLPGLIEQTRWCAELKSTLHENAFRDIHMRYLTLYGSALITARK